MVDRNRRLVRAGDPPPGRLRLVPAPAAAAVPRALGFLPAERVLQRPTLPPDVVVRGGLVDVLREHTDVPVVLVTGSPGFGKTTLVAEWDTEGDRPFTWLTADETCNDPILLATYLVLALQQVADPDPGVIGAL